MIVLYFKEHLLHDYPQHPENASRIESIKDRLREVSNFIEVEPEFDENIISRVHSPEYVEEIKKLSEKTETVIFLDPDTYLVHGTYRAAVLSANLLIKAYELRNKHVFALTRPPGHHADKHKPGGFCIFNNVAILTRLAVDDGLDVLVLDLDYHHGNGTQNLLPEEAVFVSIHRYGVYPGTGHYVERDEGRIYNIPLPFGWINDLEYFYIFEKLVIPIVENRNPDIIIISMGFDGHQKDLLGDWALVRVWRNIFKHIREYRIVMALEGGYNPSGILGGIRDIKDGLEGKEVMLEGPIRKELAKYIDDLAVYFNLK